MELAVYFWVEDITVFIRELIRFFGIMHPNNKTEYREKFDALDNILFRYIYLGDTLRNIGVDIYIEDYDDEYYEFIAGEYGTYVNVYLMFDDAHFGKRNMLIAEIVNWIMRTSDTDLAIENEGGMLNFKRVNGMIYYGKESDFFPVDYIPVKDLDFDRVKAFEFTKKDEWVFCSEEHIQKMERWRKQQEKPEKPD